MNDRWYANFKKIGVLGGGQLGRMMIQAAVNLDIELHMMDSDPNAPCSKIAHSFTCGNINDYKSVLDFGLDKDVVTVEIENVCVEALEELEKHGKLVFPQPRVLRIIRDKGTQKEFFKKNKLPTSEFKLLKNLKESKEIQIPFVHKLRTGGYDGKGVNIIKTPNDLENSFDQPSLAENLVDFKKELSLIVARNAKGETITYPLVECEFNPEANLVEFLFSPADVNELIEAKAKLIAIETIEALDMVGILAVELFLTQDDQLLINEIAPRPHNSGHHTIECCQTNQFEQHLRAILNLPLGKTELKTSGAMLNLLGAENYEGEVFYDGIEKILAMKNVFPHLYGKSVTKPFRKMGHITITGENMHDIKEKSKIVANSISVISKSDQD